MGVVQTDRIGTACGLDLLRVCYVGDTEGNQTSALQLDG